MRAIKQPNHEPKKLLDDKREEISALSPVTDHTHRPKYLSREEYVDKLMEQVFAVHTHQPIGVSGEE